MLVTIVLGRRSLRHLEQRAEDAFPEDQATSHAQPRGQSGAKGWTVADIACRHPEKTLAAQVTAGDAENWSIWTPTTIHSFSG
jgi:hypothetical protein